MNHFDGLSLFPVYIDMPLKKAVEEYISSQLDYSFLKELNKDVESDVVIDANKLLIAIQSDYDIPHKLCAFRFGNELVIPKSNYATFINSTSDLSDIDSVEIIQEGDAVLGAEELQTLISTVLKLINK